MKVQRVSTGEAPSSSAFDGEKLSALGSGDEIKSFCSRWTGGWVGHRTDLDTAVSKRKIPLSGVTNISAVHITNPPTMSNFEVMSHNLP
jgi:hypothetical protein